MFQGDGLLPFLDVVGFCLSVYLFQGITFQVDFFQSHLFPHEFSREGDNPDVVSKSCLHGHDVPDIQFQVTVV